MGVHYLGTLAKLIGNMQPCMSNMHT